MKRLFGGEKYITIICLKWRKRIKDEEVHVPGKRSVNQSHLCKENGNYKKSLYKYMYINKSSFGLHEHIMQLHLWSKC